MNTDDKEPKKNAEVRGYANLLCDFMFKRVFGSEANKDMLIEFLNMVLEIKALNGKHSVGYVDTTPEGMQGKEFTFYHEVISDVESYRQKLYGSIPLVPFSEQLQPGDTLRFVVNTYDKGNTSYEFTL